MTPSELINTEIPIPPPAVLKERMEQYHSGQHNEILESLKKRPELKWILDRLLEAGYFDEGKRVKDIEQKIKEEFNAHYRSSAISNALIQFRNNGQLTRTKQGNKNYLYQVV
jgi:hypothetical protein